MNTQARRWILSIGGILLVVLLAGFFGFQFAIKSLQDKVVSALGPNGEVGEIRVGLTGVEISKLRIRAEKSQDKNTSWPAEDELRAEHIRIVPSLFDLFNAQVVLNSIRIEGAYFSMLRARDGKMKVLPSLLDARTDAETSEKNKAGKAGDAGTAHESTAVPVRIEHIAIDNGTIEFFDATIVSSRQAPHKLRLEKINASISKLRIPDLKGQSAIKLEGILKGVKQDGTVSISGTIELATKESGISSRLHGVDLVALQPYLIKATESGVKRGTLDFELNSSVKKGLLRAPGSLTLSDLELASSSTTGTLMGMPRNAAIAMMKNRKGKISVNFVLEGDINDPHFSLNENLATRIGTSIAGTLGVSIEGLAKGVESLGGGVLKGIGKSLGKLNSN